MARRDDYYREDRLKRSQYNYKGADKLMPNDNDFINNATWTALLLSDYHRQIIQRTPHRVVMTPIMIHQVAGVATHGVAVALMAVALAEVGKQKKDLHKCASLF